MNYRAEFTTIDKYESPTKSSNSNQSHNAMRIVILLLLNLFLTSVFAQKNVFILNAKDFYPIIDDKIHYRNVVQLDEISSDEIFTRAKVLFANMFVSSPDVTKMEDKDNGIFIIKSFFVKGHNPNVRNPKMWFTLTFEARDGRYRYSITDIKYTFSVHLHPVYQEHEYIFQEWAFKETEYKKRVYDALSTYHHEIDAHFKSIIEKINSGMKTANTNDDW